MTTIETKAADAIRESIDTDSIVHLAVAGWSDEQIAELCDALSRESEDSVDVNHDGGARWAEYWGDDDGSTWRVHVDF